MPYNYPQNNRNASTIAIISIAVFTLLWGLIWQRLESLDARTRKIEQDVAAIKTAVGDEYNAIEKKLSIGP